MTSRVLDFPLEDRVRAFVAAHPGRTARQIARGVHVRYQEVRDILGAPVFERVAVVGSRAVGYSVAGCVPQPVRMVRRETPGDAGRPSQTRRLLAILADGEWHRSDRLHAQVFCILHSRVSELRRRGYVIEHRGGGAGADQHEYRLVAAPVEAAA